MPKQPAVQPPVGIMPLNIASAKFNTFRVIELTAAISRFVDKDLRIPTEWIDELNQTLFAHNANKG